MPSMRARRDATTPSTSPRAMSGASGPRTSPSARLASPASRMLPMSTGGIGDMPRPSERTVATVSWKPAGRCDEETGDSWHEDDVPARRLAPAELLRDDFPDDVRDVVDRRLEEHGRKGDRDSRAARRTRACGGRPGRARPRAQPTAAAGLPSGHRLESDLCEDSPRPAQRPAARRGQARSPRRFAARVSRPTARRAGARRRQRRGADSSSSPATGYGRTTAVRAWQRTERPRCRSPGCTLDDNRATSAITALAAQPRRPSVDPAGLGRRRLRPGPSARPAGCGMPPTNNRATSEIRASSATATRRPSIRLSSFCCTISSTVRRGTRASVSAASRSSFRHERSPAGELSLRLRDDPLGNARVVLDAGDE